MQQTECEPWNCSPPQETEDPNLLTEVERREYEKIEQVDRAALATGGALGFAGATSLFFIPAPSFVSALIAPMAYTTVPITAIGCAAISVFCYKPARRKELENLMKIPTEGVINEPPETLRLVRR